MMKNNESNTAENDQLFSSGEFKKKLFERINGISSVFDIKYPINPKLRYEYPPINEITLENIINALISCPKFYTQTLHLMNKMNLPCPLVSFIRTARPSIVNPKTYLPENKENVSMDIEESSESEIETELDADRDSLTELKKISAEVSSKRKKLKLKELIKSKEVGLIQQAKRQENKVELNEFFETDETDLEQTNNKIKNKVTVNTNVYDRQIIESGTEGFAKIIPIDKNIDDFKEIPIIEEVEAPDNVKFISKGELETNRLKISELKELPVCKNYARGEPSSRLYLKNLAKDVEDSDLKFIFGRYIDWNNQVHVNSFDIRHMKEGRMKGQAFITLPNEDIAGKALTETNGYLLKDKPMIVFFARSAKPK